MQDDRTEGKDALIAASAVVMLVVLRKEVSGPVVDYRLATTGDASAIGAVHVMSWRETYAGLLPRDMLDGLSADRRSAMWAAVLEVPASPIATRVYVAESAGEIIAFGACGGQRDDAMRERGFVGEIGAIYVLQSHHAGGVGRALMNLLARDLMARPVSGASLWVLRENLGARGFYERLGGAIITEKAAADGDRSLHEVAYGWPDLPRLIC